MVFVMLVVFISSSGYFWQNSYEVCKEQNFSSEKCELQKKAFEASKVK